MTADETAADGEGPIKTSAHKASADDKASGAGTADQETSAYIDAAAAVLGLHIRPEWKANVAMFVDVARGMAARVEATGAASATEAAPVFSPRPLDPHRPS